MVINNAFELRERPVEASLAENLVEQLQQEHPDTEPELIETAINDAIDLLLNGEDEESLAIIDVDAEVSMLIDEADQAVAAEHLVDDADTDLAEPEVGELEDRDGPELALPEVAAPVTVAPAALAEVEAAGILNDARRQAQDQVDRARADAERLLSEADQRAAEIERAAYDRGFQEGLTAGTTAGDETAAATLRQVAAVVDEATREHDALLERAEPEMVALSLEIARKIIQAELRTNPDVVKSVLDAAVKKVNGSPRVTIKINAAQVDEVKRHWAAAYGDNYREKEWLIEADPVITPGGCLLSTKYGSIDANIGVQFEEIQRTFALLLGTAR